MVSEKRPTHGSKSQDNHSEIVRTIPPRSQFYRLEPIGTGHFLVESFTSYIMRLAYEQNLSVRDTVAVALSGVSNPKIEGVLPLDYPYAIDGVADRVVQWVSAFERSTARTDLRYSTLLPLREGILGGALSRHRQWCAICLDEWIANSQIIYEPLLWRFKAALYCPVHMYVLERNCPKCLSLVRALGSFSRPGYCELCGGWLGSSGTSARRSASDANDPDYRSTREIAGLLKLLTSVRPETVRAALQQNLSLYIQQVVGGNVHALAAYIGCPFSATVHSWLDGARIPRFDFLLRISGTLSIPLAKLFDSSGPTAKEIASAKAALDVAAPRDVHPRRPASEIRIALLEALNRPEPPRLLDVAQELGYTCVDGLHKAERELSRKIEDRYRKFGQHYFNRKTTRKRICDRKVLEKALLDAVNSKEPISITGIALSHGYATAGSIQYHFPKLYAALALKAKADEEERRNRIRRGLEEALREDPAPSLMTVVHRLGYATSAVMRGNEPELTSQLVARYRNSFRERGTHIAKEAKAMMKESSPPSLAEVCSRLGMTAKTLNVYAPGVRKEVARRYREWKLGAASRRRKQLFEEVHHIVTELDRQGIYPTSQRILALLSPEQKGCWLATADAISEARESLR